MKNFKYKIFFSYTTRDGLINKEILEMFKNNLNNVGLFHTYIDLIDNDNIEYPQKRVLKELKSSTLFFLIKTPFIAKSPWVEKEIHWAKKNNIPIYSLSFKDFISISKCTNDQSLYNNISIKYIMNSILKS